MDQFAIHRPWVMGPIDSGEWVKTAADDQSDLVVWVQTEGKVTAYGPDGQQIEDDEFASSGKTLDFHFSQMATDEFFIYRKLDAAAKRMLKDEYGIDA